MQNSQGLHSARNYKRYQELAFQYNIAAATLWVSILDAPYLFNPCMFLARHTIELLIKGLIFRDCENAATKKVVVEKMERPVNGIHDLSSLWQYYLDEKQPSMLPTIEQSQRITKEIKSIFKKDADATEYRYPEPKKSGPNLNLNPITIKNDVSVFPAITKRTHLLALSANTVRTIKTGASCLNQGATVFNLIEELFQLIE